MTDTTQSLHLSWSVLELTSETRLATARTFVDGSARHRSFSPWSGKGKRHEAHELLAGIYDWFTEGFGTLDLREARLLLAVV